MGLFDFWQRKPTQIHKTSDYYTIANFYDDDYCQIELIPSSNAVFISEQIVISDAFINANATSLGFTKPYVRQEQPETTLSKEIRLAYLDKAMKGFELPQIHQIVDHTYLKNKNGLSCYGFSNFKLFFDIKGGFVNNIWLSIGLIVSVAEFEIIVSALHNLGEETDLILVDWNESTVVNLSNRINVNNYLMQFFK